MAKMADVASIWKNIREIDLRPIRTAAEQALTIALVGNPGSGRHTLAAQLRRDPARPHLETRSPVWIASLDNVSEITRADLIVLVLDASATYSTQEQELAQALADSGKKVLLYVNKTDLIQDRQAAGALEKSLVEKWSKGKPVSLIFGSATDPGSLLDQFVPAVIAMLPDRLLALGRLFPLFRIPIARQLINDTCVSNAAYALSTGIAQVVPILDIPLNVTDMVVLTKAQAFLVYKLGLVFGFSTRWQDYVAEFGSVIGGGFMWRQLARFLVGLIPVWGIVPKVAVAYSGTFVVGNAVLQWYLTGRHLTRRQMKELSSQAFERGKNLARSLLARAPRPRLSRRKRRETQALPIPDHPTTKRKNPVKSLLARVPHPRFGQHKTKESQALPSPDQPTVCPYCGKNSAIDAVYCQYCGQKLESHASPEQETSVSAPGESGDQSAGASPLQHPE